ncbi:Cell division protein FtsI [Labilithrix luteola]|uniref:Cell division protein FtsI n=1 Tax=Labilithrix luteola TaxID=1391654 RepID=A0A0K1PWW7_9BACT|nr:penicillin-binding protein [Labilithrix luteola]AKU98025.1 Cell division protein FtsI [Labilithrix luteola]
MKNLDPARARWIRFRMGLLCGTMALGLGGFVSSAFRVQVEDGASWKETAENQRQRRLHIEPKRGAIYDRNGASLAASVEVPSVSADVVEMLRGIEQPAARDAALTEFAPRIAAVLGLDPTELHTKLASKRRFIWLKRRISAEEAQALRDLGDSKKQARAIKGLNIEGEGRRYYPGRELAGPVLGFVAPDGFGKDGLELSLDEELRGRVEEVKGLRDRSGRLIFSEGTNNEDALAGHDVTLSLDQGIQHVVERELGVAQRTYETKGASLVVMDPHTGDILALASVPGYNPNDYADSDVDARRDRAVTDRFEPGSVMKVFTVAAALAGGTLKPNDIINCEHGTYQLANVTIHDTHQNDLLSPTAVLAKSSNIGALKIGLALGEPALYAAYRRFGFGEPTGLPLPGEASGVLRPRGRAWYDVETANASFGQGVSVTTVQLAVAMSAIANGGKVMEPILVRKITDSRGNVLKEWSTHVRREAVPAGVAKTVAEMLTAVVEEGGTGVEAAMSGFRVAGKTATAQKVDSTTGKYSQDKYTASFVGFVPAEKPRLVIAVVLDEPMIGRYGGDLAGPVFRRVAEASLRYLGVPPANNAPKIKTVNRAEDPADAMLAAMKVDAPAGSNAPPPRATPPIEFGPPPPNAVRVPDAMGLGARDAIRMIGGAGLVPQVEGTGRLVKQVPNAGSAVPKGSNVRLVFEPAS